MQDAGYLDWVNGLTIDHGGELIAKKGEKNPVRLPPGEARVQFIANIEEIEQMLNDGYPMIHVYRHLIKEGKITMSVASFKNLCRPETVIARRLKKKR